jgi:dihydroorotate dehydrogenase electron transfer subunit
MRRATASIELNHRIELQHEQRDIGADERTSDERIGEHAKVLHRRDHDIALRVVYFPRAPGRRSRSHLERPPVFRLQRRRTRRSADRRAGPAGTIRDGESGDRLEPLLRRPFSVFEVLRENGRTLGLSLLSKRIGPSTTLIYDTRPGDRIQCLGPLGRPFVPVAAPDEAWLVAGGVGLAPFATLAQVLRERGTEVKLYYGARRASELFYLDMFRSMGVELVLTTEDGSGGERGRITAPLERDLKTRPADAAVMVYACGPERMLAAVARLAAAYGRPSQVVGRARDGMRCGRLLQLRHSDSGAQQQTALRARVPRRAGVSRQ